MPAETRTGVPFQVLVIDFLTNALTDPRVAAEAFPFDRPTLGSELPKTEDEAPQKPLAVVLSAPAVAAETESQPEVEGTAEAEARVQEVERPDPTNRLRQGRRQALESGLDRRL